MAELVTLTVSYMGLAHIYTTARDIDWSEAAAGDCDGWEIQFPPITWGDIADHDADLLTAAQRKLPRHKEASAKAVEAFRDSDEFEQWKYPFEPMMSYVWPVMLRDFDGYTAEGIAAKLEQFAANCTLIYFGPNSPHCPEEYGFALNGGGMDLSDHIAAAYMCAGHVPPVTLLSSLAGVLDARRTAQLEPALREAYAKAPDALRTRAARLEEEGAKVFATL